VEVQTQKPKIGEHPPRNLSIKVHHTTPGIGRISKSPQEFLNPHGLSQLLEGQNIK
jgi:hypothetical protein